MIRPFFIPRRLHVASLLSFVLLVNSVDVYAKNDKKRKNPLAYSFNEQIDFKSVTAPDIVEATELAIAETNAALAKIYSVPKGKQTFENTVLAVDDFSDRSSAVLLSINILSNASPDTSVRSQAQRSLQAFSKFSNQIALDEKLYKAIKSYSETAESKKLAGARKKYLDETIRGFERNGFALSAEKREELKVINDKISELTLAFNNNIATYKDQLLVSEGDMKGLAADYIKSRKKMAISISSPWMARLIQRS
jgi:thimet oligopeptidase